MPAGALLLLLLSACALSFGGPAEAPAARETLEKVDAKNPNFVVPVELPEGYFLIAYGVSDANTVLYFSTSRELGTEEVELCVDRKEAPSCPLDRAAVSGRDTGEVRAVWRAPRKPKAKTESFLSLWKGLELTGDWRTVGWLDS